MAKKKAQGIQNRPMYSRISFLYQAAAYLAEAGTPESKSVRSTNPQAAGPDVHMESDGHMNDNDHRGNPTPTTEALSRKLLTDLRAVTLKTQIRISPEIKRTVCKYCDTFLVEGQTCTSTVENKSKGGRKPWADVLTIRCHTCGRQKRFPVNAPRQKRRPLRTSEEQQKQETIDEATSIDPRAQAQKIP